MEDLIDRLLDCLLNILAERKSMEVLGNLLTFGEGDYLAGVPRKTKGSLSCKEFVACFSRGSPSKLMTPKNLIKLFESWFGEREVVSDERLSFAFKPVVLQDKPIEESHMVRQPVEALVRLYLDSSIKKLKLRAQFAKLVRQPTSLPVFRSLFMDDKQLVDLRKIVKLFDRVELSKLEFSLFILEFFEDEKITLEQFLEPNIGTSETNPRTTDDLRSVANSNGCQSKTSIRVAKHIPPEQDHPLLVPANILELFCSYFTLIADRLPQLRKLAKKFMDEYDRSAFQQHMTGLYHRALKTMDNRFTEAFLRSKEFKAFCPVLSDIDMKEFLFVMAELKLAVSNKCLRMFFSRQEEQGVLSLEKLYSLLCVSSGQQPSGGQPGTSLTQLLECILLLEQHLEDIRQRIGSRNSNYLVAIFNCVLTGENPSVFTQNCEVSCDLLVVFMNRHSSKKPSKNALRQLWEWLFPDCQSLDLRRFCLHFLACE